MHECYTVQDWIREWGDPDGETYRLSTCPDCWPLRDDPAAWVAAATACEDCRQAIEASPLTEDVLNCPACLESFTRLHELVEELEHYDPSVAPEILTADELSAKLAPMALPAKVARVRDDMRYQQWGLAQHLLAASRELWCSDPELAHEHAVVAVEVADRVDAKTYHPQWVADLRAKAHAYLANTFRILGEFRDAELAFIKAETFVNRGTERGRARVAVFNLKASLHLDQRRFMEAGLLLEFVMAHHASTDDRPAMARTCLKLAAVEDGREDYKSAAAMCARALSYLNPEEDRRLWAMAKQNAAGHTVAAGDFIRARVMFNDLPPAPDRHLELRRLWIEGNLLRGEGEAGAARVAYGAARKGYAEDGRHYLCALVALEEAALDLDEGEPFDALAMAQEASVLLVRGAAKPEALALLRVMLTALERGAADRTVVLTLARRIAALKPSG
jgi:hypothetical protein